MKKHPSQWPIKPAPTVKGTCKSVSLLLPTKAGIMPVRVSTVAVKAVMTAYGDNSIAPPETAGEFEDALRHSIDQGSIGRLRGVNLRAKLDLMGWLDFYEQACEDWITNETMHKPAPLPEIPAPNGQNLMAGSGRLIHRNEKVFEVLLVLIGKFDAGGFADPGKLVARARDYVSAIERT